MESVLFYILFALPGGAWQGSVELHATTEAGRCEAIAAQIAKAEPTGKTYTCQTLVTTAKAAK